MKHLTNNHIHPVTESLMKGNPETNKTLTSAYNMGTMDQSKLLEGTITRMADQALDLQIADHDQPNGIDSLFIELKHLSSSSGNSAWRGADIACDLVSIHGISRRELMRRSGRKKACISEWITASKLGKELEAQMPDSREKIGVHKAKQIKSNWRQIPKSIKRKRTLVEFARDSIDMPPRQVRRKCSGQELRNSNYRNRGKTDELSQCSQILGNTQL